MNESRPDDWQTEADILADGRELLERLCSASRYRHLYPAGPNLAVLLEAYQELERRTTVGRSRYRAPKRRVRAFERIVRHLVRRDALDRNRRLRWHYPLPTPRPLLAPTPSLVDRALSRVDSDVRARVREFVRGGVSQTSDQVPDRVSGQESLGLDRGLSQLREALINEALAHPAEIPKLHPQYIAFTQAPQPSRKRHPLLRFLLVKLPLYFWMSIIAACNLAYFGAYLVFNDERLGTFLTDSISGLLEGDLVFESVHWRPRLVVDLVTGTGSPVTVRGFEIYGPYKSYGSARGQAIVRSELVDVRLVLHEIIPWNRLGVPNVFEIPWVLHFTRGAIRSPTRFDVKETAVTGPSGTTELIVGLRDAFVPLDKSPIEHRSLGIVVDAAEFNDVGLDLDFLTHREWRARMHLDEVRFSLSLQGAYPDRPDPPTPPLRFSVSGHADTGHVSIPRYTFRFADAHIGRFDSGVKEVHVGNIAFEGRASVAGSPLDISGTLDDVFQRHRLVDLSLFTSDAGSITSSILQQEQLDPNFVTADGAPAVLTIDGPLDDTTLRLAAQRLGVDMFEDPELAMDDVEVSLAMLDGPVPESLAKHYPIEARRTLVRFDTLQGSALAGTFALSERPPSAVLVMPSMPEEPLMMQGTVTLDDVNPGPIFERDIASLVNGNLQGELAIDRLAMMLDPEPTLDSLAIDMRSLRLVRDRGPNVDGLPRNLRGNGRVSLRSDGDIEVRGLTVATDGGEASMSGGLDAGFDSLRPTQVALHVSDGAAFMRAFGLTPWFDTLDAQLELYGRSAAPSGTGGSLSIAGVGRGDLALSGIRDANLWMDRGVLHLRSANAGLLGGRGPLELDVVLSDGHDWLDDPKVRAAVEIRGAEPQRLVPIIHGTTDLRFVVDDGNDEPVPVSSLLARGALFAPTLEIGGVDYHDANASFAIQRDGLDIERLTLAYARPVSPLHGPNTRITIGELSGSGNIGFAADPTLDLQLLASGVPLAAFTRFFADDVPFHGYVSSGTRLHLGGSVSRPSVEGTLALSGLNAAGVPLGGGSLEFSSQDLGAEGPLVAHRELRVKGELGAPARAGNDAVDWTVDAVVALGQRDRTTGRTPLSADLDVRINSMPLHNLLADDHLERWYDHVAGGLEGLSARVRVCEPGPVLLSSCLSDVRSTAPPVRIDLELARVLVRAHTAGSASSPCDDPAALCSRNRLTANVDWPLIRLEQPWVLSSGGRNPSTLQIAGTFDLGTAMSSQDSATTQPCGPPSASPSPRGQGDASLTGELELTSVAALLAPLGVAEASGRLGFDLSIQGSMGSPRIRGRVATTGGSGIAFVPVSPRLPLRITDLDVDVVDDALILAGSLLVEGDAVRFGKHGDDSTYIYLAGVCAGQYSLAAQGAVSGRVLAKLFPSAIASASGAVDIHRFVVKGSLLANDIDAAQGTFTLGEHALSLELRQGIDRVELVGGRIDVARCTKRRPCPDTSIEDGLGLFFGGLTESGTGPPPPTAVRMNVSERGRAQVWGRLYTTPSFELLDSDLRFSLEDVPYRQHDNHGAVEAEADLTSPRLELVGRDPLILRGNVVVERSRWIRDLRQSVGALSFAQAPGAPEPPPSPALSSLELAVRLVTGAPFRVDNNMIDGLEARAAIDVRGTLADPEVTGVVDIEPGGVVDVQILGGAFEIQRGKVVLARDIGDSRVEVWAFRQKPVYINNQREYVRVQFSGSLESIEWRCFLQGAPNPRAFSTTGHCVDYLLFGAGDLQNPTGVQRPGGGGLLARKSLNVVGNVAEIDVKRILLEKSAPRLTPYLPDLNLKLGQVGVEFQMETPREWFDMGFGSVGVGYGYTQGYPGLLLRNSKDVRTQFRILDHATFEYRRSDRSYINQRIIFDPLLQEAIELRFDVQVPSMR